MNKFLPVGRFRIGLSILVGCLMVGVVFGLFEQVSSARDLSLLNQGPAGLVKMDLSAGENIWSIVGRTPIAGRQSDNGMLEKMIVANGNAAIDLDLGRLTGARSASKSRSLRFEVTPDAFFTILVFNDEFRGAMASTMDLIPQNAANLPGKLNASYRQLTIESRPLGEQYDLVIRDAKTGFVFFNIDGYQFDYNAGERSLSLNEGRVLISDEFAASLGRPSEAGAVVGSLSVSANMRVIETSIIANGEVEANELPASDAGTVPGPDVIVGDLPSLQQFGSSGTQVGLAVGTDSCNLGTENLNWFANPSNNHPVIPQNLYRMSGGATNNERFEQIAYSSVKHAFTALTQNICGLGCNGVGGSNLGSGCSDPYSASLNAGSNNALGSRAWINPFTGAYPRNDSATPNNNHTGHAHTGVSHRMVTEVADLNTTLNPGATYYAEGQYITPHEYVWCQANPTQCNMFNNVSYRQFNVSGTTSFSFSAAAATQRMKPALNAWAGASLVEFRPDTTDGMGIVGYKVTNPSPGVWHYEYAVYNQNLDKAIQSFSLIVGTHITLNNVGFHMPPQHPGWSVDGTVGNTGFSATPWSSSLNAGLMTWNTETFAQNPNANAIRWGTMYNFRFDSDRSPMRTKAIIGFFKNGQPIAVNVMGPSCSRLPESRCSVD